MSISATIKNIKIFADGASLPSMLESARDPRIAGLHDQPDADAQGGRHRLPRLRARRCWRRSRDKPISFEVFADEFAEMKRQAREIATWGDNVYVKIPITNTKRRVGDRRSIRELAAAGVKLNVTAICTLDQVREVGAGARGRRAVGGLGVRRAHRRHRARSGAADDGGARDLPRRRPPHRAAVGEPARAAQHRPGGRDRLRHHHGHARPARRSWTLVGKDLGEFSLETVQMFHRDAAGRRVQAVSADASFVRAVPATRRVTRGARRSTPPPSTRVATGLARVRDGGRAAVHPGRRRLGRPRQPRRQRLPQDLRLRGLRARPTTSPS